MGVLFSCAGAAAGRVSVSTALEAQGATSRALRFLLKRQHADGSWANQEGATAAVVLALANQPQAAEPGSVEGALRKGLRFLVLRAEALSIPVTEPESLRGDALGTAAACALALARGEGGGRDEVLGRLRSRVLAGLDVAAATAPPGPAAAGTAAETLALQMRLALILDALGATDTPAWVPGAPYAALVGLLRRGLPPGPGPAAGPEADGPPDGKGPEDSAALDLSAALALRGLLYCRVPAADPDVRRLMARFGASPPREPLAVCGLAEALTVLLWDAGAGDIPRTMLPEPMVQVLLASQQGDGGWSTDVPGVGREQATAAAVRGLQVLVGPALCSGN